MISLIDFYDSFTYNIVSELAINGFTCKVIPYDKITKNNKGPFILGPGPGHVKDYSDFIIFFKKYFYEKEKVVGICLGHQILHYIEGYNIINSKNIVHGQSVKINLNKLWQNVLHTNNESVEVQRYNSLAVEINIDKDHLIFDTNRELMGNINHKFLSYQFHPESIGTSCRNLFTRSIIDYLL